MKLVTYDNMWAFTVQYCLCAMIFFSVCQPACPLCVLAVCLFVDETKSCETTTKYRNLFFLKINQQQTIVQTIKSWVSKNCKISSFNSHPNINHIWFNITNSSIEISRINVCLSVQQLLIPLNVSVSIYGKSRYVATDKNSKQQWEGLSNTRVACSVTKL